MFNKIVGYRCLLYRKQVKCHFNKNLKSYFTIIIIISKNHYEVVMCQLKEIEWNLLITLIYLSVNVNTFIPKEMKDCCDTLEN